MNPPAGDVDYAGSARGYAGHRRADPRIAELIHRALGPADTVANVGAGAGSYEPTDRRVVAIEPSESMVAQRPPGGHPAVRAVAGALPLRDRSVDASMATVTIHQWPDPVAGLAELRRVTAGPVVILTFDPAALDRLWLTEYAPDLHRAESARYPDLATITGALGGSVHITTVPIPADCTDGFTEAYFGRPEAFLDAAVRAAQSAWTFVDPRAVTTYVDHLSEDLASGRWDARFGHLRTQPTFEGSLRLVVAD